MEVCPIKKSRLFKSSRKPSLDFKMRLATKEAVMKPNSTTVNRSISSSKIFLCPKKLNPATVLSSPRHLPSTTITRPSSPLQASIVPSPRSPNSPLPDIGGCSYDEKLNWERLQSVCSSNYTNPTHCLSMVQSSVTYPASSNRNCKVRQGVDMTMCSETEGSEVRGKGSRRRSHSALKQKVPELDPLEKKLFSSLNERDKLKRVRLVADKKIKVRCGYA